MDEEEIKKTALKKADKLIVDFIHRNDATPDADEYTKQVVSQVKRGESQHS